MYVINVNDQTGEITLFSGGPTNEPTSLEGVAAYMTQEQALVRYGPGAETYQNDMAHAMKHLNSSNPFGDHSFVELPSEITDEIVLGVGNSVIGHPDYDSIMGDGANSNSMSEAIVMRSAEAAGVTITDRPIGTQPMADHWDRVEFEDQP